MTVLDYRSTFALIALNAALITSSVLLWRWGENRIDAVRTTTVAELLLPELSLLRLALPIKLDTAVIQEKAIFHTQRSFFRPPPPTPLLAVPAYSVVGLMVLPNGKRTAYLARAGEHSSHAVRTGDDLDGWKITDIAATRVQLERDTQRAELLITPRSQSSGLIRTSLTPRVPQTGIRQLSGGHSSPRALQVAEVAHEPPHTFRLPPR